MAKLKLDFDYDYDFLLFGISCHAKDYRLCHFLNKQCNIRLKKQKDFQVNFSETKSLDDIPYYLYEDAEKHISYFVVANQGSSGYLMPELKQMNYFVIIEGYYDMINSDDLIKKLKEIPVILTAYKLDPNQLKSKENLYLLFEYETEK